MWTIHTGTYSRRYPYWVSDGSRSMETADGRSVRRFATAQTAQAAADRANKRDYDSPEVSSARIHISAAIRMLTRVTRDSTPDDARISAAIQLAAIHHSLRAAPEGNQS